MKTAVRHLEDMTIMLRQAQSDGKWIVNCGLLARTIDLFLQALKENK